MKSKIKIALTAILILFYAPLSGAEEKFGIKVYTGAKPDRVASAEVSGLCAGEVFCYRTGDSVEEVVNFYKKEAGMKLVFINEQPEIEGAIFQKGDKGELEINIESPYEDATTGRLREDTLISIIKNSKN